MSRISFFGLLTLALISPSTLAHTGETTGFTAGLLHVFTGFDHLISMIAIGVWAACLTKATQKTLLALTPVVLMCGMLIGTAFEWVSIADTGIALALILVGVLISSQMNFIGKGLAPKTAVAAFVAVFLLFHGVAHTEAFGATPVPFAIGLMLSSGLLQMAGLVTGNWLTKQMPGTPKLIGTLVSLTGIGLISVSVISG